MRYRAGVDPATRMRALLRYTNRTRVAEGLTEAGYPVTYPTVNRWAQGRNVTPKAVALVEDLLGKMNEPRPEWAEALEQKVDAIQLVVNSNAAELAALRAILEATRGRVPQSDGDQEDGPSHVQPGRRHGR